MAVGGRDQQAIERLYLRYGRCIDEGDAVGFVGCFTADGVLHRLDGSEVRGIADLTQFVVDFQQRARADRIQYRHLITSVLVEDTDPIAGSCYSTLIAVDADGTPELRLNVTYADLVVETEDGWRFSSRAVKADRG